MDEFLTNLGKVLGIALGIFGINRAMNAPLNKRITALENAPAKRTETECGRLQTACPVAVKLVAVEKQNDGMTRWMERIELKLDRLIERDGDR